MKKIKVAPIGTCRIHTPLRRAALHYPFQLDLRRNYGFVHSSSEVRQQLDLILGGTPVPEALWPLVYRPTITENMLTGPAAEPDFYFFEISSRKHLTIDDNPIQINYLYRNFSEFFRDTDFAPEFWNLTKAGDLDARRNWLEALPIIQNMPEERIALLNQIHMREMTDDEIAADMQYLADRVGADNCVFITHVNAVARDNKVILSRQKLIQSVMRLGKKLKLRSFDPTEDMRAFGQKIAMERDGADSTHYNLPFAEHIGAYWFETYIQPKIEGADHAALARAGNERRIIARLDSMLELGQLVKVSTEVHEMLRQGQGGLHALRLLAKLSNRLGDYQRVIDTLQKLAEAEPLSDEDDSVLMAALLAMGHYQEALDIGRRLLANESENDHILSACAKAATELGLSKEAEKYWMTARAADENNREALVGLLRVYTKAGLNDEALAVAEEILILHPDDESALIAKWGDAIADPERTQFDVLVKQSKWFSDETSLTLAKLADHHGNPNLAASLLALKTHIFAKTELYEAADMRRRWERIGNDALSEDDFASAAKYLRAAAKCADNDRETKQLRKKLDVRFRLDVRAAYSAKNYAKVMRLADVAEPFRLNFAGFSRIVGKAAVQLGDIDAALPYLKKDAAEENSPVALLYLGRMASKVQDYLLAYRCYHDVLIHDEATLENVEAAQKAMGDRFSAAMKHVRHLSESKDYDGAWALLDQLALHSDQTDRLEKERSRILRLARIDFKGVDAENAADRLARANQYLRLDADDLVMRRLAAVSAMRCADYPVARDHWVALAAQTDMTPQIESALEKCATLIERAEKRKAG